jgi:hypothetical protein
MAAIKRDSGIVLCSCFEGIVNGRGPVLFEEAQDSECGRPAPPPVTEGISVVACAVTFARR